jgi:hypothetical protein
MFEEDLHRAKCAIEHGPANTHRARIVILKQSLRIMTGKPRQGFDRIYLSRIGSQFQESVKVIQLFTY